MTQATWAYGTKLSKDGEFIGELTNITGPDLDSDEIDVTNHDSVGGYEEVIQSIRRTGVVGLEGNFVPTDAGQKAMLQDYIDGTVSDYKITFPTAIAVEWSFKAFVKKPVSTEAPVDGKIPFSAELRVTGFPSLDVGETNNLSALAVSDTDLMPAFDGDTYEYVGTTATGTETVTVTPDSTAGTIYVEGTEVVGGVASDPITLGDAGTVTPIEIVVKEEEKVAKTYTVLVARASA